MASLSSTTAMPLLRVTLVRSRFGRSPAQTASLKALGLRRINHTRELHANPGLLGNLRRVVHLLRIETVVGSKSKIKQ